MALSFFLLSPSFFALNQIRISPSSPLTFWYSNSNLYQQAAEAFGEEEIISEVSIRSPLELVGETFTKKEMEAAILKCRIKTETSQYIAQIKHRKKIEKIGDCLYKKI